MQQQGRAGFVVAGGRQGIAEFDQRLLLEGDARFQIGKTVLKFFWSHLHAGQVIPLLFTDRPRPMP